MHEQEEERMKEIRMIFLLLAGLLVSHVSAFQAKAVDMTLRPVPHSDRLPANELLYIFQDSEGYMWYGTEGGGLCRDDGYTVDVFRADFRNPGLLESNSVTCITEDCEGKIWFSTKRGIYILSKENYQITPLPDLEIKGWNVKTMRAVSDGTVWVSARGLLLRYDASGKKAGRYIINSQDGSKTVNSIYEDKKGTVWVTQEKGGLLRYDKQADTFVPYPWPYEEEYPTGLVEDTLRSCYWLGTWGKGIVRFKPDAETPDTMFLPQKDGDGERIHCILQDAVKGYLWVTTTHNLEAYRIREDGMPDKVDTSSFLSGDKKILTYLLSDRSGNLWVTGYYPSSFIVSFLPDEFTFLPMEPVKDYFAVSASPMQFSCEKDFFWVRQKKQGLYSYHPADGSIAVAGNNAGLSFFFEKPASGAGIYMVRNDSILLFQDAGKQIKESVVCRVPLENRERVRALHDDKQGNLWIGTTYNVFRYSLRHKDIRLVCGKVGFVNSITSSPRGEVYFATEAAGLWKISDDKGTKQYDTQENYMVLSASADSTLWVGTQQGNVYCYNPQDSSFVPKTKDCGLLGDVILDLKPDKRGNVWILTAQRVTVYDPRTRTAGLICCSDPWVGLESFRSLYEGADGEMSIGGRGGILTFPDFNKVRKKTAASRPSLTSIQVNHAQRRLAGNTPVVLLKPGERHVELFFSTFSPLDINKVRYAYRNRQAGGEWNYIPAGENSLSLTGLSKGDYEIEVCATTENGLWNENTVTVLVRCLPAWYETWWACLLYVSVISAGGAGVLRKYVRKKKRVADGGQIASAAQAESVAEIQAAGTGEAAISLQDEQFLNKVREVMERNISNPDYSVEDLSKDMCMSRATLYRRINSITGASPSDFMKHVRLQRAAELLKEGGLTVVEVADKVGFNTPGYFSKSFKKMFGVLPTQYK